MSTADTPPESLQAKVDSFGVTATVRSRRSMGQLLAFASGMVVVGLSLVSGDALLFAFLGAPLLGFFWVTRRPQVISVRPDGISVGSWWIPSEELAGCQVIEARAYAEDGVRPYRYLQITTRRPWRTVEVSAGGHSREDLEWLSAAIRSVAGKDEEVTRERAAKVEVQETQKAFIRDLSEKL